MTGGSWRINTVLALTGALRPQFSSASISTTLDASAIQSIAFGTAEGEMSILVDQTRPLPAGVSETHNLFDGSLLDIYGDAAKFRKLRGFAFQVHSGGDSSGVTIRGGDSNPCTLFWVGTTPGQIVYPDGPAAAGGSDAGITISSSACTIKVTNNSAVECSYRMLFAGSVCVPGSPVGLALSLLYP